MDKDTDFGGWLIAIRGSEPTMFYAAAFDDPDEAIEAVRQRRAGRDETYEATGRYLRSLETLRDLPSGVAVPL